MLENSQSLAAKRDALMLVVNQNDSDNATSLLANMAVDKDWLLAVEAVYLV